MHTIGLDGSPSLIKAAVATYLDHRHDSDRRPISHCWMYAIRSPRRSHDRRQPVRTRSRSYRPLDNPRSAGHLDARSTRPYSNVVRLCTQNIILKLFIIGERMISTAHIHHKQCTAMTYPDVLAIVWRVCAVVDFFVQFFTRSKRMCSEYFVIISQCYAINLIITWIRSRSREY